MRLVANEKHISRREQIAQYASWGGMAILVAALIFSFNRNLELLAMQFGLIAAMAVGMVLSFIGGYFGEQFSGPAAQYLRVRQVLKGLGQKYVLFQYTAPVPHLLLGPDRLTVIVVKSQPGEISYVDGKWSHHQRGKFFRQMAGQESLGRPEDDAQRQVEIVERYLERHLEGVQVDVQAVLFFAHPEVKLDLQDPPLPAFSGKKIKNWLRSTGKNLPDEVWQEIAGLWGQDEGETE